jgi:GrpB-like predicted nucleotidyltransferase (UPF0157 family)
MPKNTDIAYAQPPRVVVAPHDPTWGPRGLAIAEELRVALGPLARRADHIGSTSIPGMAAKNIFDLQVSVDDLDAAARAFDDPLRERGYQRWPYEQDHVPAGHDDDPALWAKRLWVRRVPGGDSVNLHVRRLGSPNERLALLFRDWFRAHPDAVPSYARFKRELAAAVPDGDTYTDIKDPVVDLVIAVAEHWATATGWKP